MKNSFFGKASLIGGMHFECENEHHLRLDTDSKPAGELHAGPNPVELFLISLAGCAGMETLSILRKRKKEPEKFDISAEGIKRVQYPRILTEINLIFSVKGPGITLIELNHAVGLTLDKYCAISNMIKESIDINWTCEIINESVD